MVDGVTLAGRVSELRDVAAALCGDNPYAALLIRGEPGIGKSRLVAAARGRAEAASVLVLPGWCVALSEGLPFAPIIDALRALAAADEGRWLKTGLAECPRFVGSEISRLLPELHDGEDAPEAPGSAGTRTGDAWQRQRLFEAVRRLLAAARQAGPIAVVIEDLHWADATTLAFLDVVLEPGRLPGVLLVLTCRSDEPMSKTVAGWLERTQRNPRVRRVELSPLSEAETGDQIALLSDRRPAPAEVRGIYARSDGNPFFTEQLVSAAVDGAHGELPSGLTALLLDRTETLIGAARDVVTALAVAGTPLREEDLGQLCGRVREEIREAARELAGRRLLRRPGADGGLQLRHALLAEAIAGDLLPGERGEWHVRVAEFLARRGDPALAAQIAEHYAAARIDADELRWRVAAGRYADAMFAAAEAAVHWQRALALSRSAPPTFSVAGMTLAQIYTAAEDATELSGPDDSRARLLAEEALQRLVDVGAADRAEVSFCAGWLRARAGRADGLELMREADRLYRDLPPCPRHVETLEFIGIYHVQAGQEAEAYQTMCEAAALAEQLGDRAALLRIRGFLALRNSDEAAAEVLEQLSGQLRDTDPPDLHANLAVAHTHILGVLGHHDRVAAVGRRALQRAAVHGIAESFTVNVLRTNVAESMLELGAVEDVAQMIEPITRGVPEPATHFNYAIRAHVEMLRGNLDDSRRRWAELHARSWVSLSVEVADESWEMETHLWSDDPDAALDCAKPVLPKILDADGGAVSDSVRTYAATLLTLAMRACADLADDARANRDADQLAVALGDAAKLHGIRAKMRPDPFVPGPARPTATADAALWDAEQFRASGQQAPELWRRAADAWAEQSLPHRAAYALWRQGEALLARSGGRSVARAALRSAARLAGEHRPLSAAVADLAHRARLDLREPCGTADAPAPSPPSRQPATPWGLTERELAVLRLVAEGRTNAEIGATLFMSTKTASVHVTHILRKLDVASRVQAAAVAARAGLSGQAAGTIPARPPSAERS